ncbi:glutaminyl-peptide cyclotransferase [Polaribacter sp.]|jgi:glutaminyl-peptide cyclotransferase|uniref:glutaminyl-peptide cyclotransferase n=1 Tax=Polaribacter sp. TaxID=1920175 RepID=UPI000712932F|nr:MAG: glutamine cyclotransferase [Cryomorphaceae bacterium BACL22 MAG-120619-bin32]
MKNYFSIISLIISLFFIISCDDKYNFTLEVPKKTTLNKSISGILKEENNKPIDSVQFLLNGIKIPSNGSEFSINTKEIGVGKQVISALIFYLGKTKKQNNSFEVLADVAPEIYTFNIINSYPHDSKAYTQGLEYHKGFLYETTGRKGQSSLRKVEINTGKVLQKIDLDNAYFGEGMTIFNDKIFWLTWQSKKGFVYNLDTFELEKEFEYNNSGEGWGFTHNDTELIKSDGTNKVWFLDPETQKEKRFIQIYTNKYALDNLNELELIDEKLYANKYQQNAIVLIDINTGVVLGVADLTDLKKEMEKSQKLVPNDEVLNGIAFDKENNRIFVTGKNWAKLFEIELVKKQ